MKINWHFFATSHGKGVVDGLGGSVKRSYGGHVKTTGCIIDSVEQYAVIARDQHPNIIINYVSTD